MEVTHKQRRTTQTEDFDQAVEEIIRDPETEQLLEDTDALLEEIDIALEEADRDAFRRKIRVWAEKQAAYDNATRLVREAVEEGAWIEIPCGCL